MKTIQAWIARDESGLLCCFDKKPTKLESEWMCLSSMDYHILERCITNTNFPNIKWEDKEPTEVEITIKIKQNKNN